jgi:hypothetical protein
VFGINWPYITARNAAGMFDQPESIIARCFVESLWGMASVGAHYATWKNCGVNHGITAANLGEKIALVLLL